MKFQGSLDNTYTAPDSLPALTPTVSEAKLDENNDPDPFVLLKNFKDEHAKNMLIGHYNVNSYRHKFQNIKYILEHEICTILGISETKLDESFT